MEYVSWKSDKHSILSSTDENEGNHETLRDGVITTENERIITKERTATTGAMALLAQQEQLRIREP